MIIKLAASLASMQRLEKVILNNRDAFNRVGAKAGLNPATAFEDVAKFMQLPYHESRHVGRNAVTNAAEHAFNDNSVSMNEIRHVKNLAQHLSHPQSRNVAISRFGK